MSSAGGASGRAVGQLDEEGQRGGSIQATPPQLPVVPGCRSGT